MTATLDTPVIHPPAQEDDPVREAPAPQPETTVERRYAVSSDFDGVLHSYTTPWQGAEVIPDPPIEGAIDWLHEVAAEYDVVILTTRARHPGGAEAVEAYLREHGYTGDLVVTAEKLPALMYVDDRGWRFRGRFPTLKQIRYMKPWRTGDAPVRSAKDSLLKRGQDMNRLQERHRVAKAELQLLHATLATVRTRAESLRESVEFREATEPLYPELTELLDALLA